MKKIALFLFATYFGSAHCANEHVFNAIYDLDVENVRACLHEKALGYLTESDAVKLMQCTNDMLLKTYGGTPWYKKHDSMIGVLIGVELLYLSGRFIKKAFSHNRYPGTTVERIKRFYFAEPSKKEAVAGWNGAAGHQVDITHTDLTLCIAAGALATVSTHLILSSLGKLLSGKNSRYTKALAIKALVQDALARNNLLEKAAKQSLLRMN